MTEVDIMLKGRSDLKAKFWGPKKRPFVNIDAIERGRSEKLQKDKSMASNEDSREMKDRGAYLSSHEYQISLAPGDKGRARTMRIIKDVCEFFEISRDEMLSGSRDSYIVKARRYANWRASEETDLSLTQIGRIFDRDHTTILHAIRTVWAEIDGVDIQGNAREGARLIRARRRSDRGAS